MATKENGFSVKNPTLPATKRQTWAIFCALKVDVRKMDLTRLEASAVISAAKSGRLDTARDLLGLNGTKKTEKKSNGNGSGKREVFDPVKIVQEAEAAGEEAGKKCIPQPMIVQRRSNPLDDNSEVEKEWFVPDGLCGFAWVNVSCKGKGLKFINVLKRAGLAGDINSHCLFSKDDYYKGYTMWVHYGNQSIARKEAYAKAFTSVLEKYGIPARWSSRLD